MKILGEVETAFLFGFVLEAAKPNASWVDRLRVVGEMQRGKIRIRLHGDESGLSSQVAFNPVFSWVRL